MSRGLRTAYDYFKIEEHTPSDGARGAKKARWTRYTYTAQGKARLAEWKLAHRAAPSRCFQWKASQVDRHGKDTAWRIDVVEVT